MSLFAKKYNLGNDKLIKVFDLKTNQYNYAIDHVSYMEPIDYKTLDTKTKKSLLKENKNLLLNKELLEYEQNKALEKQNKMIKSKERFNYLKSIGFECDSFVCYSQNKGSISDNLKQYLDDLLNEENVLVGIHRVGPFFDKEAEQDIFENGLMMTGHLSSGAVVSKPDLRHNVSYYPDNDEILKQLMYAGGYKNSKGSILIRIPDNKLETMDDLYITNGVEVRLNPKYIVGYVPVYENNHIENIEMNPNYIKEKETYLK